MDSSTPTTTRKQLRGYGASRYLARKLTASLAPVDKAGNAYVYALEQVIAAVRDYSAKQRIQQTTKQVLAMLLSQLLARIDNIVSLVPDSDETEVSDVAKQLLKQMRRTDKALAEVKATVASMGERAQ